jgi:hypothetical protein
MKKPKRNDLDWKERLGIAAIGLLTIIYGYGQILRGQPFYTNSRGLDLSAQFVIFLGAALLFAAVFPWGRIHFLWKTDLKKRRR